MALIPCKKCGSHISDKAQECPKCGASTKDFSTIQSVEKAGEANQTIDSPKFQQENNVKQISNQKYQSNEHESDNRNNHHRRWIIIAIVSTLIVGGVIGFMEYRSNKDDEETRTITQYALNGSTKKDDESDSAKPKVYNSLKEKLLDLQQLSNAGNEEYSYFVTDLNKNGIPQLWVIKGSCVADSKLCVYYFDSNTDELKLLESDDYGAWDCSYHLGDSYIIECSGMQGYTCWNRIYLRDGQLHREKIYEESNLEEYPEPEEPYIEKYSLTDMSPISIYFKP